MILIISRNKNRELTRAFIVRTRFFIDDYSEEYDIIIYDDIYIYEEYDIWILWFLIPFLFVNVSVTIDHFQYWK